MVEDFPTIYRTNQHYANFVLGDYCLIPRFQIDCFHDICFLLTDGSWVIPPFTFTNGSFFSPPEESEEAEGCCISVDVELASLTTYNNEGAT